MLSVSITRCVYEQDVGVRVNVNCVLTSILNFLLYTKKETIRGLFTITYGCYHGSRSVL